MAKRKLKRHHRAARFALGAALATSAGTLPLVANQISQADAAPAQSATSVLGLQQIKELNYMPSSAAWTNMWTNWNPAQINADYAKIASLHANTVRVVIEPSVFGFPNLNPVMVGRFDQLLSMAAGNGLHVQLTLFDWFGNYDLTSYSTQFINSFVTPLRNDPQIAFIELKNEIDPTSALQMQWARAELPVLRAAAGSIPITVSVSGRIGGPGLSQLKGQLGAQQPDFYDLHYYGTAGAAYASLAQAKQAVAPVPLFVGEAGMNTDPVANGTPEPILDSAQDLYYRMVEGAAASLGLGAAAPWTLYDFTPAAIPAGTVVPSTELHFGLIQADGVAKPALATVAQFFATGTEPVLDNPSFETVANGIPTDWVPENAGSGALAVDSTVSHSGTNSVSLSHTAGVSYAQPDFYTEVNLGAITPGQRFQATVWARGSGVTGQNVLAVSWFSSGGIYLGNSQSAPVAPGTSGWNQLSVTTTAPQGAAYAQIHLQSYQNAGTVWYDDVTFANA